MIRETYPLRYIFQDLVVKMANLGTPSTRPGRDDEPPKPIEIRFTFTDYPGITQCSKCGVAVFDENRHRLDHQVGN